MNYRSCFVSLSRAAVCAAALALATGSMIAAADARGSGPATFRGAGKDKKPTVCFEEGCKGDHCIYCKR
jgi:hypothetical protein